ncbi:hypothetical protein E4U43_000053 [Claviceps pusilla]|uniref:Uncharacterized protein n=1 Tax=Claviceps pusilla TaxID=123648 RepID=A0A9P7T0H9_9HYPO|nr:hypothetical protein E4U43_000053 [Claviceps pusilla]
MAHPRHQAVDFTSSSWLASDVPTVDASGGGDAADESDVFSCVLTIDDLAGHPHRTYELPMRLQSSTTPSTPRSTSVLRGYANLHATTKSSSLASCVSAMTK